MLDGLHNRLNVGGIGATTGRHDSAASEAFSEGLQRCRVWQVCMCVWTALGNREPKALGRHPCALRGGAVLSFSKSTGERFLSKPLHIKRL